jgi:hypothetical protein
MRTPAALAILATLAHAQVMPPPQPYMLWRDGKAMVFETGEGGLPIVRVEGPGQRADQISLPDWAKHPDFADGSYWATRLERRTGETRVNLYQSDDARAWHWAGVWSNKFGILHRLVPLFGGKFLAIAATTFQRDQDRSPFAILTTGNDGTLAIEGLVPLGLEKIPMPAPMTKVGPELLTKTDPTWIANFLALGTTMVRYPDGIVICAQRPGYFWILDDGSSRLKVRLVRLYDSLSEEKLRASHGLGFAVLGVQPRPNGHLLVAARTEAAVLDGAAEELPASKGWNDEVDPASFEKRAKAFRRHPELVWWDLDPKSGTWTADPGPQGVPDRFSDPAEVAGFTWRFKGDGNLLIGQNPNQRSESPPHSR